MIETVRSRLRSLIHLIEQARKKVVYTNFRDEIGDGTEVALPGTVVGMDFERFRKKAQSFLRAHMDRLALMKLRRNEQMTETDLSDLENILLEVVEDAGVYLPKVKEEGLVAFVQSLVGLDRDAIRSTFGAFVSVHHLSAAQIEFMDLMIDHLSENGVLDPARLYDSPFTDIHQHGVGGLFREADVISLIDIVQSFHAPDERTG
jgi:type I restriction enzyme, R subunit